MFSSAQAMTKYQTEGAPGYLTQGEMLQALAPAMTVRGDTFTVRTYGDCRNPFTGQVESKAYLEITAQRLPDYTDGANEAAMPPLARESRKVDIVNENTKLTAANKVFGRKFVITSARWISANDL